MLTDLLSQSQMELHILLRLFVAGLLGGLVGYERQWSGKRAGLRTHMLVAMGSALFVSFTDVALTDVQKLSLDGSKNVSVQLHIHAPVQAIITGIGFLGAGTIFVGGRRGRVHGLTTAASIWIIAAVGVAVGFDRYILACGAACLILIVLHVVIRLEPGLPQASDPGNPEAKPEAGPSSPPNRTH